MLKVRVSDDTTKIEIVENGKGEWRTYPSDFGTTLVGYDGEIHIYIHRSYMQSGTVDLVVILSQIDDYQKVYHRSVKARRNVEAEAVAINRILLQIEKEKGITL